MVTSLRAIFCPASVIGLLGFAGRSAEATPNMLIDVGGSTAFPYVAKTNGDYNANITLGSDSFIRSLTGAQLRADYDVIYITGGGEDYGLYWSTQIKPFLQLGGGVVIEQYNTSSGEPTGMSAAATETFDTIPAGPMSLTSVPGLTDGVTSNLTTNDPIWTPVDSGLSPFWTDDGADLGLYGQYGAGRIIFTAHLGQFATKGGTGSAGNDYQLALNELNYVTPVPEPAAAGIVGVGFATMALRRRRHVAGLV
jgi:hypothetical protein